eukprot:gene10394-12765_t
MNEYLEVDTEHLPPHGIFTFEKYLLYFDELSYPRFIWEKNETPEYAHSEAVFSFQFLNVIKPRKVKISTSMYEETMPLNCIDNILNCSSLESVKLANHPSTFPFLLKALNHPRITSLKVETCSKFPLILEPLSKNKVLRRLVIKNLPKNMIKSLLSCLINNKNIPLKALGLETTLRISCYDYELEDLEPLLMLPKITT